MADRGRPAFHGVRRPDPGGFAIRLDLLEETHFHVVAPQGGPGPDDQVGAGVDRKSWEPVTCLHMPKGSPGNLPVKKVASGPDAWEVTFEDVENPAHEAGFSPDG